MTLKDVTGGKVEVNNRLDMDNQERFINVAIGYEIQSDRMTSRLQKWANDIDRARENKEQINRERDIMRTIQTEVNWLGSIYPAYCKHLNNSIWCRRKLKKTVKTLEKVIADIDVLVGDS